SAQIREILISESTWEEMTCLFAPSLADCNFYISAEADSQIPHENTPAALATGEEIISAIP
ncbi:hypothetical protein MZF59_16100, partial [Escherichia coli]|nr:hypothetical protein [Escherichia coli]